ncbi:hypothetical protein RA210_U70227 [Rubrivivax sp. A210]|nr:hypothetical protein RA210_U70227 [Rubrivivax sp. A210]
MGLLPRQLPGIRGRQAEAPGRGRCAAEAHALQAHPLSAAHAGNMPAERRLFRGSRCSSVASRSR